jgi:glycolate oxidase iron-sulfur subunit
VGAFDGADAPSLDALRACVHCGICLPQCPTYRLLGEEMDSPRGRLYLIRAAAEGRTGLTPTLARHLDLCLGCRACESACPSGVPFGSLLEAARGQLERLGVRAPGSSAWPARLLLGLFGRPERRRWLLPLLARYPGSGLQAVVRRSGLPGRLGRLGEMEALLPDRRESAGAVPEITRPRGRPRGRAGLVLGCLQRHLMPGLNADIARLLAAAGWEVRASGTQGCCGALHLHAGRIPEFRDLARRMLGTFDDVDVVVTGAAGCGATLRAYGHWLDETAAHVLAARVRDVSEVLAEASLPLRPLSLTVAYQDPCHLAHGQRVRNEPRALLARIPGLTLAELPGPALCCGSAGIYNVLEPGLARDLGRLMVERLRESGARVLASGNPGCLLQIARHCREAGLGVEVTHPARLAARALGEGA